MDITQIPVKEIVIDQARRKLSVDSSMLLEESIALIGLRTPISVRARADGKYDLVAGRQRLLAVTQLGHEAIDAFAYPDTTSDLEIELWELIENLHRSDLNTMERATLTGQYARLQEKAEKEGFTLPAHSIPEPPTHLDSAEHTGGVSVQLGQKLSKRGRRGEGRPKGGTSKLARDLGRPRATVRRELKIDALKPEVKDAASALGLDDNQEALLKAAKHKEPEKQVAVLQEIAAVKAQPAIKPYPAPLPQVTLLDHAWDNATDEERDAFLDDVALPWRASRKATV